MSQTLCEIYEKHRVHGPDCGHGDMNGTHSYGPIYERLLEPYRGRAIFAMMEIGVAMGLALSMWREWCPTATIIAVDLSFVFDTKPHEATGTKFIAADATKPEFITKLGAVLGDSKLDFVRDDASHMMADQIATFQLLKPRMREGSIYCIEDILSLESSLPHFLAMHDKVEVYDQRHVKGRFDDCIIAFRF